MNGFFSNATKKTYILRFISISFFVRLFLLFRLLFVIYSKHEQTFCDCDNFSRFSFPFSLLSLCVWVEVFENSCVQQTLFSSSLGWTSLVRCCFAVIPCWCIISVFLFRYLLCSLVCSSVLPRIFLHPLLAHSRLFFLFQSENSSLRQMFGLTAVLSSQDRVWKKKRIEIEFFLFIVCIRLVWAFIRYEICQVKVERRLFCDCDCIRKLVRSTTAVTTTAIN